MNKNDAYLELMNGKNVRAVAWSVERFLTVNDDGQVVDNNDEPFNFKSTRERKWELFIEAPAEVDEVNSFDKKGAMNLLMNGERITTSSWDENDYILMNDDGQVVDNNDEPFNFMSTKIKEWVVFIEAPVQVEDANNTELFKMISGLYEKIETLEDTVKNMPVRTEAQFNDEVSPVQTGAFREGDIKERSIEDTIKIFYNVGSASAVRELFKTELLNCSDKKDMMMTVTKFIPFCYMGGRKIKTVARYYSDMRNIIKDVNDQWMDLALDLFSVPADVYERIKEADTEKVLEKIASRDTFSIKEIEGMKEELRGWCVQILNMGKMNEQQGIEFFKQNGIPIAKQQTVARARAYIFAIYVALVTGRRITEILQTLSIVKKGKQWIFRGLLKKKKEAGFEMTAMILDKDVPFVKKLLVQIQKDIDTTTTDKGGKPRAMTAIEVNSLYNHVFNRSLKRITGTNYTFHDLREIYAELAYLEFGKNNGTEREEIDFKSDILGHQVDKERLVATEHYMTKKGE